MRILSVLFFILLRQIAAQPSDAPTRPLNDTSLSVNGTIPSSPQSNITSDGTVSLSNETIPTSQNINSTLGETNATSNQTAPSAPQPNTTVVANATAPSAPTPSAVLPEPTAVTTVAVRENVEMIEIRFKGVKALKEEEVIIWETLTEEWMLQFYEKIMATSDQPLFNFRTFVVLENQTTYTVNNVPYTEIIYSQFVAFEAYPWSNTAVFYARYPFTLFDANTQYGQRLRSGLNWKDLELPVEAPLMPGETRAPTMTPTATPTDQPSGQPSTSPSLVPSITPTFAPSATRSGAPSSAGSPSPTARVNAPVPPPEGSIVNETLLGLQLTLRNAGALVEIEKWEKATAGWFTNFFVGGPGPSPLRRLQAGNVENVNTQFSFVSNNVTVDDTNTSINTITYDQALTYVAREGALSFEAYATLPFEDNVGNTEYGNILKTFSNMEQVEVPLAIPFIPDLEGGGNGEEPDEPDNYDDGMSAGGIVGILFALLIVALALAAFVGFNRRKRQREKGNEAHELSTNSELPEDQFGDVEQDLPEQPVISKVASLEKGQSYGLQSVATDEYDYDKAYVLRDQVRSANSATSGSSLVYDFNKLEEDSVMSAPDSVFTGKIGAEAVMAYENKHRIRSASSSVSSRGSSSVRANQTTRLFGSVARNEQVLDVIAPAGKLGLIIDTPNEGPPVVYAIKDSSILGERVCVDDRLIAIDDIDVRNMTAIEVSKLISSRNAHPERKLTLLRKKQLHSQL